MHVQEARRIIQEAGLVLGAGLIAAREQRSMHSICPQPRDHVSYRERRIVYSPNKFASVHSVANCIRMDGNDLGPIEEHRKDA